MLSKQQKLRYGEVLRQQMKEKQERKKQEQFSKRGQPIYNVPKTVSNPVLYTDPGTYIDPKDVYQKKLETQDYNPFGKAGGGAPNMRGPENITANNEGNHSRVVANFPEEQYMQRQNNIGPITQEYINPMPASNQRYAANIDNPQNQAMRQGYQSSNYQNTLKQYPDKQYSQSPQILRKGYEQPPPQAQIYQQKFSQQPRYIQPTGTAPYQYNQSQAPYPQQYYMQQPIVNIPPPYQPEVIERVRTLQNEQMQEMYKRGGRNLLKLQNETVNEHLVKQKQKIEMQNFLKQQIEEVQRKKQMEKEKIKRQELEEERKNKEYIEMQNQKLRDEERKKNEEKQRIVIQNQKNLAYRKELEQEAKNKIERQRIAQLQGEKRRNQLQHERSRAAKIDLDRVQRVQSKLSQNNRYDQSQTISNSSEQSTHGKGFNTDISKQFFKKEREKQPEKYRNDKKLQLFTAQIQKMRDQITNQGDMFQKQIEKIKRQSEQAQDEKRRAQLQIERLKLQLEKKNKQNELRLFDALKRNDPYGYPPKQQRPSNNYPQYDSLNTLENYGESNYHLQPQPSKFLPPTPNKMTKANKVYNHPDVVQQTPYNNQPKSSHKNKREMEYEPNRFQQSEVMTLESDSKKIPINLPQNSKLTMSKLQNYGKESFMYPQAQQSNKYSSKSFKQDAINEQFQDSRVKSRKSTRVDELDKLVESRGKANNNWQMSTVKDDITKQIQDLLKKKGNYNEYNQNNTQMSQAGRQVLSRGGLPYQGPNLNTFSSNRISAASNNGTLDIDKIYDRNQARLRQLKALGVQTVNTNNDQDMNRLNQLLKNYH